MAELADAGDLKSPGRKAVRVRFPVPAPVIFFGQRIDKSDRVMISFFSW
jgi:hypothetical protein